MTTKFSPHHILDNSLHSKNLHLKNMTSDDKDELIGELYNEVARLQRVLDALMIERDQLITALDSRQADSNSQGNMESHIQPHNDIPFPFELEEILVSDDTLRRSGSGSESDTSDMFASSSESDSCSISYPTRCGTPFSAPPNISSFPEYGIVRSSYKRERRLSLPLSDLNKLDQYYSIDEVELEWESSEFVDDVDINDHVQSEDFTEQFEEDTWDKIESEEELDMSLLVSNRTHFLNNAHFEMPTPRTGWEKYARRTFIPCLQVIPETGDFLITFPIPVRTESVEIRIEEIPRCASSLGFNSPSEKKSWFDMTLEDEEDEFW